MPYETASTVPDTSGPALSTYLRQKVLPLWQRQLQHPFVVALGNGSLPQANFQFYICQDALFLDVLTKTFSYALIRATEHEDLQQFGTYALDTLLVEADLHRRYGERFGLTPTQMAAALMTPTNYAYTRHLLSIATTGTLPEIVTAILPCAWIYAEGGRYLVDGRDIAPDHPYADWLATYASEDFDAVGAWLRGWLDRHANRLRSEELARLQEIFLLSTRYEWLFWDMAWRLEEWPS